MNKGLSALLAVPHHLTWWFNKRISKSTAEALKTWTTNTEK